MARTSVGAPFEGQRRVHDVDFYVQDISGNPPPNDDLDLQLVWLNAVERFGSAINAHILGEYWLSFIVPDWVEYGAGKNNLRMGFLPPISGYLENPYRDSCGAFIRSEIWACLTPGHPDIAVRYAFEDAIVDHAGEGVFGEVFCAAIESAAFVESDKYNLLSIGLSYIPEDCGVARGVKAALDSYRSGVDFQTARRNVLTEVPGSFGINMCPLEKQPTDVPAGPPGYDAPSNIGIMVIGWLYGEDDFGKSLCIANNCGEDTDCTCATLGAILGIIHGARGIPERWSAPLGDKITTCCINEQNGGTDIPRTTTELTERLLRATPGFLGREFCDLLAEGPGYTLEMRPPDALYCQTEDRYFVGSAGNWKAKEPLIRDLLLRSPFTTTHRFPTFTATLDYREEPHIRRNEPRRMRLIIYDNGVAPMQKWVNIQFLLPEGLTIAQGTHHSFFLQDLFRHRVEFEFDAVLASASTGLVSFVIDLALNGRHSNGLIKATLLVR